MNKHYLKYILTDSIPEYSRERLSNFIEATQLTPDLLGIDWLESVIMMTQNPIDLWSTLSRIINEHDSAAIIIEQFMDISLQRYVKTYLIKIPVGDDFS